MTAGGTTETGFVVGAKTAAARLVAGGGTGATVRAIGIGGSVGGTRAVDWGTGTAGLAGRSVDCCTATRCGGGGKGAGVITAGGTTAAS